MVGVSLRASSAGRDNSESRLDDVTCSSFQHWQELGLIVGVALPQGKAIRSLRHRFLHQLLGLESVSWHIYY